MESSKYQKNIYDWISAGRGNLMVNAVAGSGKTTTLVAGSKQIHSSRALFCAFNKSIQMELSSRLSGVDCKTLNGFGHSTVCNYLKGGKRVELDDRKYFKLARPHARELENKFPRVSQREFQSVLVELTRYCQATLTNPNDTSAFNSLIDHFQVDLPTLNGDGVNLFSSRVGSILDEGEEAAQQDHVISFSDQLWLPAKWKLEPTKYDWIMVDEAQDLNAAQLDLVLRAQTAGGRMIFVGDPRQAIYGFAGADSRSFERIREASNALELPLSVCYRCPVLIIREAQRLVPQIEHAAFAEMGTVRWMRDTKIMDEVREGDMILCRLTAPLVELCFRLIAQGVPARIKGRDIGKQLTSLVQSVSELAGFDFMSFPDRLTEYTAKQIARLSAKDGSEAQIESWCDRRDALIAYFDGVQPNSVGEFKTQIESLFSDDRPGVMLSTVHRAKGLEYDRVFILRPDKLPLSYANQQAWQREQEYNLKYVAITRAKSELIYVEHSK